MKKLKKIALIGGTGKSGKYIYKHLLEQGYYINALVRNPERIQTVNPLTNIVIGDVNNYEALKTVINGCDAVVSALGSGIPPSQPAIFSLATSNIIKIMKECGIRRYIVLTGLNVDTPLDIKGTITKAATDWMYAHYPISTADRQLEYELLYGSNIDWTLVRLPLIELTDTTGKLEINLEDCPGDKISATDLANFVIEQITGSAFIKKAPFIANV